MCIRDSVLTGAINVIVAKKIPLHSRAFVGGKNFPCIVQGNIILEIRFFKIADIRAVARDDRPVDI